jgi:hypothetical protein
MKKIISIKKQYFITFLLFWVSVSHAEQQANTTIPTIIMSATEYGSSAIPTVESFGLLEITKSRIPFLRIPKFVSQNQKGVPNHILLSGNWPGTLYSIERQWNSAPGAKRVLVIDTYWKIVADTRDRIDLTPVQVTRFTIKTLSEANLPDEIVKEFTDTIEKFQVQPKQVQKTVSTRAAAFWSLGQGCDWELMANFR